MLKLKQWFYFSPNLLNFFLVELTDMWLIMYFLGLPLPLGICSSFLTWMWSNMLLDCKLVSSPPNIQNMVLNLAIFSFRRHLVHIHTPKQKGHSPVYLIFSWAYVSLRQLKQYFLPQTYSSSIFINIFTYFSITRQTILLSRHKSLRSSVSVRSLLKILGQIGVTRCINVHFRNGLFVGCKFAGK